jgi:hypothetical protein
LITKEGAVAFEKMWQPLNLPAYRRAVLCNMFEALENAWFYQKTKSSAPTGKRSSMVKY